MVTDLIDFHTHILPHMDDGSRDLQTSEEMLRRLRGQGVDSVVLTPHFYSDREPLSAFLDRRAAAVRELQPVADRIGIRVFPACEMYFSDYIFNYKDISDLCILNGEYLLTEFSFSCGFSDATFQRLERLTASQNVTPILAHIERYPPLMKNPECLKRCVELGCLAQINLGGFSRSGFRQRRAMLDGIRDGLIHLVGTDCHNLTTRPPEFLPGLRLIEKKAGTEAAEGLMKNARRILQRR
jgi:protein-tyrosine phosphatase